MTQLKKHILGYGLLAVAIGAAGWAESPPLPGEDSAERAALAAATDGKGFGPQSPRDIDQHEGSNPQVFGFAPEATRMTLCNIHLHESAEHKGGEFTTYAGDRDARGDETGFKYDGTLSAAELAPLDHKVGEGENGDLIPGDTVEAHFVYSTAQATPGPGLTSCFTDAVHNPQLRVEAVVGVLVNDPDAADFVDMARFQNVGGLNQLPNLPGDLGMFMVYNGSTTGAVYDEKGSPVQVTWSVRPKVVKIDITSLDGWFKDNPFHEQSAHHVRNLVTDPALLSRIE